MKRRQALGLLGVTMVTGVGPSVRDQFVGAYTLVTYQRRAANGQVTDVYGPNPVGRISYDAAGHVWALLTRPGRQPAKDPRAPTLEEYREIQSGLVAYFGTFDVDESSRTVTHHIEVALNPAWVGTDFVRKYELSGNRLTLTIEGSTPSTLVWERLPVPRKRL